MYDRAYYDNRKKEIQLEMIDLQNEFNQKIIGLVKGYEIEMEKIQKKWVEINQKEETSKGQSVSELFTKP